MPKKGGRRVFLKHLQIQRILFIFIFKKKTRENTVLIKPLKKMIACLVMPQNVYKKPK